MNILILSGRFGMGHQMAAKAIGEQLEHAYPDAAVTHLDLLAYLYPYCSRFIFRAFQMLVEHCYGIYNLVYKLSGKLNVNIKPAGNAVYKKLKCLMAEYKPDIIVCTLPLCAKAIASYIEKTGSDIPLVTCVTDISTHPEWFNAQTDLYLAPTRAVKESLVKEGADPEQILVTGIPIRQQFLNIEKEASKIGRIKKVLIMGGGLGIMPELEKLIRMLHGLPDVYTTVVAGSNQKAFDTWQNRFEDVAVMGFTESISTYMNEADLVITKVGGITLFELIQCEVPLFAIHPFLEQEVNNARYAQNMGIARVVWNKSEDFLPELERILTNERDLEQMKTNIRYCKQHSCDINLTDAVRIVVERMIA